MWFIILLLILILIALISPHLAADIIGGAWQVVVWIWYFAVVIAVIYFGATLISIIFGG